jgi:hypothetical protein
MKKCFSFLLGLTLLTAANNLLAQGTAFTYQGQLTASASPANGNYDFTFALFNNSSANSGQVGSTLTNLNVGVTNGLFTVTLDFGNVFNGNATWLAIGVRTNGGSGFTALSPLQELTPTPYAVYAPNAGAAASANSVAGSNIVGNISVGQLPPGVITNGESGANISGAFTGNGVGITNIPSTNTTFSVATGGTGVTVISQGTNFQLDARYDLIIYTLTTNMWLTNVINAYAGRTIQFWFKPAGNFTIGCNTNWSTAGIWSNATLVSVGNSNGYYMSSMTFGSAAGPNTNAWGIGGAFPSQ